MALPAYIDGALHRIRALLPAGGERRVITAEEAIQEEVAAIEGRTKPEPVKLPEDDEPEGAEGKVPLKVPPARTETSLSELGKAIAEAMADPPPPPVHALPHGNPQHPRPPGGGIGMVDTRAQSPLAALCLSGGGIRSASFCLGAVQALARQGLLSGFHYLSTVSGGGYTGSMIARLIRTAGGVAPAERMLADPQLLADQAPWLTNLRSYTSYLAPRLSAVSLDVWAAVILYIRNTLANWLLFLPGLLALALLPRLYLRLVEASGTGAAFWSQVWPPVLIAVPLFLAAFAACLLVPGHQGPVGRRKITFVQVAAVITVPLVFGWALLATLWFRSLGRDQEWTLPVTAACTTLLAYVAAGCCAYAARLFEDPPPQAHPIIAAPMFLYNAIGWLVATLVEAGILLVGVKLAHQLTLETKPVLLAITGPAWIVLSHLMLAATYAVWRREAPSSWMDREWIARASANELLLIGFWTVLAAVCLLIPHQLSVLVSGSWQLALPAILTGPIAAWLGRSTLTVAEDTLPKATLLQRLPNLIALLASIAFLAALLVLASAAGWRIPLWVSQWTLEVRCWSEGNPGFGILLLTALLLSAASWGLGQFVININRFSLHELYRNRLVRAFLGAARPTAARRPDGFASFDEDDSMPLAAAQPFFPDAAQPQGMRLFPVVNVALNLVSGTRTAWSERKAASFTMTPLRCGSAILKTPETRDPLGAFQPTRLYGGAVSHYPPGEPNQGLRLGTAMTISGAAVSPNAGYHSSATTSFIMTLFNARLGAWLPNPGTASAAVIAQNKPPNGFLALLWEMLGLTDDQRKAVYLSDGGHFDNLGIYEMLRRRCRLIVALDAGADPDYGYFDLGDALRKARIDLGVEVTFAPGTGPAPGQAPGHIFYRATIEYPSGPGVDSSTGTLLYMKNHLPTSAPADVLAYKAAHAAFPHDTTSNQFFTESQFESYRRLGVYLASS